RLLAEAQHALGAIVEPPRRAELEYWIMARQRGELARVDGFVEREQNHREPALVAEAVEQRLEGADIVGTGRDVGALVAAEEPQDLRIVVAERAWMDLHHEAVLQADPRHLGQHLAAKCFGFGRTRN